MTESRGGTYQFVACLSCKTTVGDLSGRLAYRTYILCFFWHAWKEKLEKVRQLILPRLIARMWQVETCWVHRHEIYTANCNRVLCVCSLVCMQVCEYTGLCARRSLCTQFCVSAGLCACRPVFHAGLCVSRSLYAGLCVRRFVYAGLCARRPLCTQFCVSAGLCARRSVCKQVFVRWSVCTHFCVYTVLWVGRSVCPQVCSSTGLCVSRFVFPQVCVSAVQLQFTPTSNHAQFTRRTAPLPKLSSRFSRKYYKSEISVKRNM